MVAVGDADGGAEAVEGEEQEGGQDEQRVAAHQADQDGVDRALHLHFYRFWLGIKAKFHFDFNICKSFSGKFSIESIYKIMLVISSPGI